MRVSPDIEGGIEVIGGPWTTGQRAKDTIESTTRWGEVAGLLGRVIDLEPRRATGPGVAECRWSLPDGGPAALHAFSIRSLSHDAGFNVAGLAVGTDGGSAWVRLAAGKVPDRPEPFGEIEFEAALSIVALTPSGDHADGADEVVPSVRRLVAAGVRRRGGINPRHRPEPLPVAGVTAIGLAGFSWTVTNTPNRSGRYLRRWVTAVVPGGVEFTVSNSGMIARPTDLDLEALVVTTELCNA